MKSGNSPKFETVHPPVAQLSQVALMIGLHRMPRHKSLRHQHRRSPEVNVTPAVVREAQAWVRKRRLKALLVCPLSGDGGALRQRLQSLDFQDRNMAAERAQYTLGLRLDLRSEVCEEAPLLVWLPPPTHDEL